MEVQINYPAVVTAVIVTQILGSLWYSPLLFGKAWVAAVGVSEEKLKEGGVARAYVGAIAGSAVMAYVLAHFVDYTLSITVAEGLQCGFWLWLGFIATTAAVNSLFEKRPLRLYLINQGYHLACLLAMGAILAVWQ
ncbi:MAG: DUF1761 domain-containing protein [Candidatus Glassbacteria bacterium]